MMEEDAQANLIHDPQPKKSAAPRIGTPAFFDPRLVLPLSSFILNRGFQDFSFCPQEPCHGIQQPANQSVKSA
jgi:hypothetical protein